MNWNDIEDDDFDSMEDDDFEETDETFSVRCTHCGADVYEDCEMCPVCNEYIIRSTNPLAGKPDWYVWMALLGIIAVIFAMLLTF